MSAVNATVSTSGLGFGSFVSRFSRCTDSWLSDAEAIEGVEERSND